MKDVQSQFDERNISLNEVGIKDLVYPVEIKDAEGNWMTATADISCSVGLGPNQKGTHMSRFVEVLQESNRLDLKHIHEWLQKMRNHLDAETSFLNIRLKYFVHKKSPVTGNPSLLSVDAEVRAALLDDDRLEMETTVCTPVTTLCPCSKEISDYSAHNQRALVTITANTRKFIPFETFVKISEDSASSPLYTLLKRPDEKYVTEYAYDHPRFVEDVCREAKQRMDTLPDIRKYDIQVESMESIHNHQAFAKVLGGSEVRK